MPVLDDWCFSRVPESAPPLVFLEDRIPLVTRSNIVSDTFTGRKRISLRFLSLSSFSLSKATNFFSFKPSAIVPSSSTSVFQIPSRPVMQTDLCGRCLAC